MRALCFLILSSLLAPTAPAQEPIPVLLVTGANNHDWKWTHLSLERMLEANGRFDVTITTDPAKDLAATDLGERFRAFVLDYNGPRWGEPAETNFLAAVEGGVGVSIIHASNNAFPGWIQYEKLCGLLWRQGTGHGRFHSFSVDITDRDHPITRGLPTLAMHPDELYHRLVAAPGAENRVLASAFSDPETGGTDEREPMIIVQSYGAGRIFHTPLGHVWSGGGKEAHEDPQFQNLVVRGTEWAATGVVTDGVLKPNSLTELEKTAGWELLFDGTSTDGWRGYRKDAFPAEGWEVAGGSLVHTKGGGDIITEKTFEDFEFEFEWKVAAGANSGVKYRVKEREDRGAPLGPEYQVLDDSRHADGNSPRTSAASLYALAAPEGKQLAITGAWNHGRIAVHRGWLEHWVNGVRVIALRIGSDDWNSRVQGSKYKGIADFGIGAGHIALQDHGDEVWYRSLKIRDLSNPAGEPKKIIEEGNLDGWHKMGDADYSWDDGSLLGKVTGGRQSFLLSDAEYGDFILEVDVKTEEPGNSGIQIRTQLTDKYLYGYQIEIDPSERSWSGGLYEEGRRGWLQNLTGDEHARGAFKHGEWNRYRMECVGPWIRTWVNGVPVVDYLDGLLMSGVFGLQVHSGNNTRVRWRDFQFHDLGTRTWTQREYSWGDVADAGWERRDDYWVKTDPVDETSTYGVLGSADGTQRYRFQAPAGLKSLQIRSSYAKSVATWDKSDESFAKNYKSEGWNEVLMNVHGGRAHMVLNGRPLSEPAGGWPTDGSYAIMALYAPGKGELRITDSEVLNY